MLVIYQIQRLSCTGERRWMDGRMGHFYNEGGDDEGGEVLMSVLETERGETKGGLIVQGYSGVLSVPHFPERTFQREYHAFGGKRYCPGDTCTSSCRLQEHKVKSRIGRAEKEEMVETSEDIINNLERLPEGCISDILSLITSPADVCRSRLVSTLFKSAADSDALWEKFLPADYQDIISRAFYPFPSAAALSKKELYYRLCNEPLLIDGGLKSFQLEKSSGKKCIMLGAKELDSAWGDNPQHWYWRGYPGSRYAKVAELKWSCWLEIHGKLKTRLLSPKTFYAAYFVLKFKQDVYGFDNEHIKANVEVVVSLNLDPRRTPKCCKPLFGLWPVMLYHQERESERASNFNFY